MQKSTKIGFAIFVIIVIGGIYFFNSNGEPTVTGGVVQTGGGELSGAVAENGVRRVQVDAKRWDFGEDIRVKQGENVMLMINNIDTTHGIIIPELGVSGNNVVTFTADKKGEYKFLCNNFCGSGHKGMTGKIIVE